MDYESLCGPGSLEILLNAVSGALLIAIIQKYLQGD